MRYLQAGLPGGCGKGSLRSLRCLNMVTRGWKSGVGRRKKVAESRKSGDGRLPKYERVPLSKRASGFGLPSSDQIKLIKSVID